MPYLILVAVVLALIYWLFYYLFLYWYIALPIGIAITVAIVLHKREQKRKADEEHERWKKRTAEEAERKKKEEYEAAQREVWKNLTSYVEKSENAVADIARGISESETALARAEQEFAEGAFAPFWDAVEHAATHLAKADSSINQIIKQSKLYRESVAKLNSSPPAFTVGFDTLPDTTRIAGKMHSVVRRAQKDFHFATIYEQRKTNKLLIAGFKNLAEALNGMTERLESSIDALSDSLSDLAETNRANTQELLASVQKLDERITADSGARREYEGQRLEQERAKNKMLDNIQRGRRPRKVYPKTFE